MKFLIMILAVYSQTACGGEIVQFKSAETFESLFATKAISEEGEGQTETEEALTHFTFKDLDLGKGGEVCIAITPKGVEFPEAESEDQLTHVDCYDAEGASSEGVFISLEDGSYAAAVFHDENGNRELDKKRLFPFTPKVPTEDYGFSGNPNVIAKMGRIDFDDCAFEVNNGAEIVIRIRNGF